MPPFGLYASPRHHLYGGLSPTSRPVFNTLDFEDYNHRPTNKVIEEAALAVNSLTNEERMKKDKKKKTKKKGMKMNHEALNECNDTIGKAKSTPKSTVTSFAKKNTKDKNKNSTAEHEPSAKKRKRDTQAAIPIITHESRSGGGLKIGADLHQELDASIGERTNFHRSLESPYWNDSPLAKKKIKKSQCKNDQLSVVDGKHKCLNGSLVNHAVLDTVASKNKKNKETCGGERMADIKAAESSSTVPAAYASVSKKSPVPLRQKASGSTDNDMSSSLQPGFQEEHNTHEFSATETPPKQALHPVDGGRKNPVALMLATASDTTTEYMKSKQALAFSRNPAANHGKSMTTSAPATLFKSISQPARQASLTWSDLRGYTQPLDGMPKPRPRGRDASVSSGSSLSIKDAFARANKPLLGLKPISDRLVPKRSSNEAQSQRATQIEADTTAFPDTFPAVQNNVDFSREDAHLIAYTAWQTQHAHTAPQCLKNATGCSSKAELALLQTSSPGHVSTITTAAVAACATARTFLAHALAARVPVPLGALLGSYALYCPTYAAHHVDKFGDGQRALDILPCVDAFASSPPSPLPSYMARLALPPRSMPYSTLPFAPPPHASFGPVRLITTDEGCTLHLTCLGAGYVLVRMNLGLLLMGKSAGELEFFGVRQGAVVWDWYGVGKPDKTVLQGEENKKKQEVEDKDKMVGRESGLVAGRVGHGQVGAEDSPSKKKRGRPTNAERERRAHEAARGGGAV